MFYSLYGHTVESKVPLDSFGIKKIQVSSSSDIIKLDFLNHSSDEFEGYVDHQTQINHEYGYYFIKNIALFEVLRGIRIVIKYFNEIDDDLIHSLLNYPFAILFNQRKKYVIHASSICFEEKIFCFCGKSQSGKSSLLSYLLSKGGFLISEDTCVFDYNDDKLFLLPSYNFLKISDEVNQYIGFPFSDPIEFRKKSTNRKGYILNEDAFFSKPGKVDYFIYLKWSKSSSKLKRLSNDVSLKLLLAHAFIGYSETNASFNFKTASQLVNQADHLIYEREKKLKTLEDFYQYLPI